MKHLDHSRADAWILFLSDATDPAFLARCESVLCEPERHRAGRFVFPEDRRRYALAHGLLRLVLSEYVPLGPEAWQFSSPSHGKPHLAAGSMGAGIDFSLSHSRDAIAIAIARGCAVGVDVEGVKESADAQALADRFFSKREADAVRAAPKEERDASFIRYWTLKEAYVKARGEGLSLPLEHFGFSLDRPEQLEFYATEAVEPRPQDWKFAHARLTRTEYFSLCIGRGGLQSTVNLIRCQPGGSDMRAEPLQTPYAQPSLKLVQPTFN